MPWFPAQTQHLTLQGPVTAGHLVAVGPQLGQLADSGLVGPTSGTTVGFPPNTDPHVSGQIWIDAGVWKASAG